MKDLEKVNATQLMAFWKQFSVALLVVTGMLFLSKVFPFYFSPLIGLIAAALLYTLLYNGKIKSSACMLIPYAMFYCMILYSFASIILNVLDLWEIYHIPREMSFFNEPYIAALLLDPVCFVVLLVFYLVRNHLAICVDCKITKGLSFERGKLGEIISHESRLQLVNLIWLFGFLSLVVWSYYKFWYFSNSTLNGRDWYVFLWINVIAIIIDELYFTSRYFNIFLDLKENGEIITEEELSDMTAKTYLRYYVICGEKIFINRRVADMHHAGRFVIDTPFVTKRNVNGIAQPEVLNIIHRLTGIRGGELRFFYGRKSMDIAKHRLLRYFYFLDGDPSDYDEIELDGEWVDFSVIKQIYSQVPKSMSSTLLTDISRMVTIVLTQKIFDERGYRRMKLKSYKPNITLKEVKENNYDFQDDKWIRISMFNSDVRSFHLKRWWEMLFRNRRKHNSARSSTSKEWIKNR